MRGEDLTPRERADRNPSYRHGWAVAASEGRLEPEDFLDRLAAMALFEFGERRDDWPIALDDDGFIVALTAEGREFDGGIIVRVWPRDHPPAHVHIYKKSRPRSEAVKINLATGELEGDLPRWARGKQLIKMQQLVRNNHGLFAEWWEKHHGEVVTLVE